MARTLLLFVSLLAGCTPVVRDMALADVDLSDMQSIQTIRAQLKPHERIAFANYVTRHHIASARFCGRPLIGSNGKAPATVGEAVDLAMLRDAAERQAELESSRPKPPRQLAQERWDRLISEKDSVIDAQTRLRMEFGAEAELRSEWKSLETRMAAIDQKLIAIKPSVFGSSI